MILPLGGGPAPSENRRDGPAIVACATCRCVVLGRDQLNPEEGWSREGSSRVVLVGLGPSDRVGKALVGRPNIEILGTATAGGVAETLRVLGGAGRNGGFFRRDPYALIAGSPRQDVVVLCTGSRLASVVSQSRKPSRSGLHVVSSRGTGLRAERLVLGAASAEKAREHIGVLRGVRAGDGPPGSRAAPPCVRVDRVKVTRRGRGQAPQALRAKVGAGLREKSS